MGTTTAQTQVIVERLGLGMDCVRVNDGSSEFAGQFLAGESASLGAAVMAAYKALVEELVKLGECWVDFIDRKLNDA
jgi:hypothetical protein